jgi:hypothetical protein
MVFLRDEVERPLGIFHGTSNIAQNQGNPGMINGDPTR